MDTSLIIQQKDTWLVDDRPMPTLLIAPSFPVSVPLLLIGRLAETPDAGAIWPQQSQERRRIAAQKKKGRH